MSNNEQPSYYAIIPANVRYDNDLKPNEKLLYGEITCLSQSTGRCFASNEYFANLYGTSKETVSRWVSNLSKKGYVKTQLIYKEGTKQIINRYIQINQEGIDKKINSPIDEKVKVNTTRVNTTRLIKEKDKKENQDLDLSEIENELSEKFSSSTTEMKYSLDVESFNNWNEHRKDLKKKLTATSAKLQIKLLCKYPRDIQAEIINASIQNGYQGLFEPKQQKQFNKPMSVRERSNQMIDEVCAELERNSKCDFEGEIYEC